MSYPRVIIRHKGPRGDGVPEGGTAGQILSVDGWVNPPSGTGAAVGPNSSVDNHVAAFDGNTGKLLRDSGLLVTDIATVALANTKVDKVTGKGLSTEDFTTALKNRLLATSAENYRGQYVTPTGLTTAVPLGNPGDYALVNTDFYIWDEAGAAWFNAKQTQLTDQQIVDLVFNSTDATTWDKTDTFILTQALLTQIEGSASLEYVNGLALAAGLLEPAYGQMYYFSLTGTSIPIANISDGSSNLVVVNAVTALDAISTLFTSPSAGRLQYLGEQPQNFLVTINGSLKDAATDTCVVALAKNGSSVAASKTLITLPSNVISSAVVSLSKNDYLEILVGNTTSATAPTLISLTLTANAI